MLSARQELVMRLDGYCEASMDLFEEVRKGVGGLYRFKADAVRVLGWVGDDQG